MTQPDPTRWRALAVCLVGGFMVLLDVSIVNVALPSIRSGLDASQSDLQWIVSGYALTFGLLLVPAGRLGDVRGQRTMFVTALGLFTLASAACGAAPGTGALIAARLLQGLAGGLLTPQIAAVIQRMFTGRERGQAFGLFGTVIGISTAVGPLLGGVLIEVFGDEHGWRWVFFVNLPIGLVAMPIAWRLLPAPDPRQRSARHDYDPVGVVLLGIGVVLLLLPFVQERQWHGAAKWLLVPAAAVLLLGFLLWERHYARREREPLVELGLFGRRSYSFGSAVITLYFAGFTPLFFVFTLFVQNGLGYGALRAGVAITPFAIGSALSAAVSGRLVHEHGRRLVAGGLALVAVGQALTIVVAHLASGDSLAWAMVGPLFLAGFGNGWVIAPNQAVTLTDVPVQRAGSAGGLLQTGQRIGAAVGIAAVGSAFFARLADSRGRFDLAYERGISIALLFVGAALVAAVGELVSARSRTPPLRSGHPAAG